MNRFVLFLALGFAAAGCSCSESAKKSDAADRGQAAAPVQQGQAAAEAAEEAPPPEPTEEELRVERVVTALRKQALGPTFDETLPTRLGNLDECRPTERRRYNLEGELVYVIVGTYPTAEAAGACIQAYENFVGAMWDRFKDDFYQQDRFVIELNPTMTDPQKDGARAAVREAL